MFYDILLDIEFLDNCNPGIYSLIHILIFSKKQAQLV